MAWDLAQTLGVLGMLQYSQNELIESRANFEEAYSLFERNNARIGMAWTLGMLGLIITNAGDYAKARSYFQQSLDIWHRLDRLASANAIFTSWELAAWIHGDHVEAKDMLQKSLDVLRASGNIWRIANGLNNLGHPTAALGQYDEALDYYHEALKLTRGQDITINPTVFLEAIVGIANVTGKLTIPGGQEQAVEWLSMVSHHPLLDPEINTIAARCLDELRTRLPPDAYSTAIEGGKQLELDDVIEHLLIEV